MPNQRVDCKPGLTIPRFFTKEGDNGFSDITWVKITAQIKKENGEVVFEQKDIEAPSTWSQTAVNIVAQKYFRGALGTPERENSVKGLICRVVNTITNWGWNDGYFATEQDRETFKDELCYLLVHQMMAFNSPVWFNVGIENQPQVSACFLQSVKDNMESILDLVKKEGMIFKYGSGSGTNFSTLRSSKEGLSGGGISSGPVSFMKGFDSFSSVIKSGGKLRRSARMCILNVDHPDIEEFIWCKAKEEKKAHALIDAGYDGTFDGEAYQSVQFQNANNSVRVTDEFMQAVTNYLNWDLKAVTTGKTVQTINARKLWRDIAQAAWECGDPGIQFDTMCNEWNTCASSGRINATNPCQPATATVLTPNGIKTFKDIEVGSIVWSGKQWTKVINKIKTGVKPVYEYKTRAGVFVGTEDHRVVSCGEKVKVKDTTQIDTCVGKYTHTPATDETVQANVQAVVDGWMWDVDYVENCTYLKADPAIAASFLKGLFSANGSVCGRRVTLKSTNLCLIEQAQMMLSSLGIRSYYVISSSGTDTHKQSYSLIVSTDRVKFSEIIGFIQKDKQEQLINICNAIDSSNKPINTSYDIVEVHSLGDMEVFDITVDADEHTYWTGGLLVSNCSEVSFLDDTSCNLASLNLLKFIPPSDTKYQYPVDVEKFNSAIFITILAQEIMVANAKYPTDLITKNSIKFRPLGLGYANLGAFIMTRGWAYDSEPARLFCSFVTSVMTAQAYHTSALISNFTTGPFDGYLENKEHFERIVKKYIENTDQYLSRSVVCRAYAKDLWYKVASCIQTGGGVRNAQVTVLAPTGTISMAMDCVTTGIEPELALIKYKSLVGGGVFALANPLVFDALNNLKYSLNEIDKICTYLENNNTLEGCKYVRPQDLAVFDCAFQLTPGGRCISPKGHIDMMAAAQPFITGSISKTCNISATSTVEDIEELYMYAWKSGLKSVAIYRDGCKRTQPLNTKKESQISNKETPTTIRKRLPDERKAIAHKFSIAGHEGYVHVGLYDDGSPGELFITMAKEGSTVSGLIDGFATVASIALQHGVPLQSLVDKFSHTRFEPYGFTGNAQLNRASSILDYIFRWLALKFIKKEGSEDKSIDKEEDSVKNTPIKFEPVRTDAPTCSTCGSIMVPNGSCHKCNNCGSTSGCS